jgi:hypothetical protein
MVLNIFNNFVKDYKIKNYLKNKFLFIIMNKRKSEDPINDTNYDNIFLTKDEAIEVFNIFRNYMGGELYIINEKVVINLRHLLESDTEQRLLPGQYSLYMWGPQYTSLWIRNNDGILQFHEYYDRDIHANPSNKYFNAFKFGYEERKFENIKILHNNYLNLVI